MSKKSTRDVYLAAAFLTFDGVELIRVDKTDPRHMEFVFEAVEPKLDDDLKFPENFLDEIEMKWVNNELSGNFTDFKNAIQRMKSVIHST
jgi:hypothetical protein